MDREKKTLPRLDIKTGIVDSPHVVLLGAGASRACCPNGDKNGRKLPVLADLIPIVGLEKLVSAYGYSPKENFEAVYSAAHAKNQTDFLREANERVTEYFAGFQLPDAPTVYDYLVLSLRAKDLIATFNWDPLLPQALKRWRHLGWNDVAHGDLFPRTVFLHGNVDVEINPEKLQCRFASDHPARRDGFSPSTLLYPVKKKDYVTEPFVKNEWEVCTTYLEEAYCVTVFGYSAPRTDVEARELLLKAWRKNTTATLAEFNVIDIRPEEDVKASWKEFSAYAAWVSDNLWNTRLRTYPRRTCETLAHATLQQRPWQEDPFPKAKSLEELEDWVLPLIAEERTGKLVGKRHHEKQP